jgi:hypothetical protein
MQKENFAVMSFDNKKELIDLIGIQPIWLKNKIKIMNLEHDQEECIKKFRSIEHEELKPNLEPIVLKESKNNF